MQTSINTNIKPAADEVNEEAHGRITRVKDAFEELQSRLNAENKGQFTLFRVHTRGLFDIYLNALPEHKRQQSNCNCCHEFIRKFGGLVRIDADGNVKTALWDIIADTLPDQVVMNALRDEVMRRPVIGTMHFGKPAMGEVELTTLGTGSSGGFIHLHVVCNNRLQGDFYKHTDFLFENYAKFITEHISGAKRALFGRAILALESQQINSPDKVSGALAHLKQVIEAVQDIKNPVQRMNIIRHWSLKAPRGVDRAKNTVVGVLINDGIALYNKSVDSSRYMRSTKEAENDEIEIANEVFQELGLQKSLVRRWATLDLLPLDWVAPTTQEAVKADTSSGVFDFLRKQEDEAPVLDSGAKEVMTWTRFKMDVLPKATRIQLELLRNVRYSMGSFTAAQYPDAPPLMIFDTMEKRYTLLPIVLQQGSSAVAWGINETYPDISGFMEMCADNTPTNFEINKGKQPNRVFFVVKGAKVHAGHEQFGSGIFSEAVRRDLFARRPIGVRRVLEEYSNKTPLKGAEEANAIGMFSNAGVVNDRGGLTTLRVTTPSGVRTIGINMFY